LPRQKFSENKVDGASHMIFELIAALKVSNSLSVQLWSLRPAACEGRVAAGRDSTRIAAKPDQAYVGISDFAAVDGEFNHRSLIRFKGGAFESQFDLYRAA
jgi:hypothetical protein